MTSARHSVPSVMQAYFVQVVDRFWSRVNKDGSCWLYLGGQNLAGYGVFKFGDGWMLAHRFSYETEVGPVPEGLTLDHLCRTRDCVRPSHLEAVTGLVNTQRGVRNDYQSSKTHCPHGHPYDELNTYVWAVDGSRQCRTCGRKRKAARTAAERAA